MSLDSSYTSYKFIKDCLQKNLREKEIRLEFIKDPYHLLIMESKQDIVAFTILNKHPHQSYNKTYDQFKKIYSDRHQLWSKRHLSFVLCRTYENTSEDSFFNEIEYDVFFCKKYVIYLKLNRAKFLKEIQSLPFIPLKPESVDALRRPISAQTLLQNCGVDSRLSYHLVKSKEKKGEKIAEDYIAEKYPYKPFKNLAGAFQIDRNLPQIRSPKRLKSLKINNFRAFKTQEFDLSGDIVILYGPNGLGKTSLYDALDFACTGRIARLSGKIDKIAPNLDSTPNESFVTLEIENENRTEYIKRKISDHNYAQVDKKRMGRKELLFHLTGLVWEDTAGRVENLEKLFRATHLFGQDYQELLIDYKKDSELSEEVVARMLAFEDYITASKKTTQVISSLKKKAEELSKSCSEFESQLKIDQNYRQKLANTVKIIASPNNLKTLIQKVTNNVKKTLRFDLPIISQIDNTGIRSWRAKIASELELIQEQYETITNLKLRFEQFTKNNKDLAEIKNTLKTCAHKIDKETLKINTLLKNQDIQSKTIQKLTQEKYKISEKYDLDNWHIQAVKGHNQVLKKRTSLLERFKIPPTADDLSPEELEKSESEIIWIKENLLQWKNKIKQIKNLHSELKRYREKRENTEDELNNYRTNYENKQHKVITLENRINKIREGESRLLKILDEIESYVENSKCPVCGVEHNTKEKLLHKIQEQKRKRPAESDAIIKNHIRFKSDINILKEKISLLERTFSFIKEEEIKTYEALNQSMKTAREFKERANRLRFNINEDLVRVIDNELEQTRVLKEYLIINKELKNISLESKSKKLPLRVDIKEIEKTLAETTKKMSDNQECIKKQEMIYTRNNEQLSLANDHLRSLKERRSNISLDIDNLSKNISEYEADLAKLDLNTEISIKMIQSIKEKLQIQINKITAIKDDIIRLETAIDSTQSSARLAELDTEIEKTNRTLKKQKTKLQEIKKAIDYYDKINYALATQKNLTVSEYAKNFGPLASIIQRRLRPVYGFGPVELKSKAGKIYVQVSRKSQILRPIDYFSDSQNHILMLSLFMAAGVTQTWSSFAPILIDDPITHFDDLNAYAFVELIRGLVDDFDRPQQFIISTCDESLWELFRQRFSDLTERAIMYKFVAIGEEGPIIKRIN